MASVKIRNRLGQWIDLILDNVASDSIYQALSARQGKLLAQGKADKATTLSGYGIADAYTKTEIDALIASVFKYKGVKATYADVEAVQNPSVGDVWFVTADSSEYAWNGTVWEKLGPVIDLSHFITQISIAGLTIDAQSTTITKDQLLTALGVYTKEEVDAMKEEVDEHLENIDSIISTDTETVTSDPVTIETKSAQIAEKTVIHIDPVQDLHGYDHPWPAGGWKNKFNDNIQASDCEIPYDKGGTGIKVVLPAGTYTISARDYNNSNYVKVAKYKDGTWGTVTNILQSGIGNSATIAIDNGDELWIFITTVSVVSTFIEIIKGCKIQIESGSSATDYAPYSNICPISGWTGAKVTRTGKNLLPPNISSTQTRQYVDGYYQINRITQGATEDVLFGGWSNGVSFGLKSGTYYLSQENIIEQGEMPGATLRVKEHGTGSYKIWNRNTSRYINEDDTFFLILYYPRANTYAGKLGIQIELGSTATAYEPYQGQTYDITFPSEAGTVYGGTLTVNKDGTGSLVVDAEINQYTGNEGWYASSDYRFYILGQKEIIRCNQYRILETKVDYASEVPSGAIGQVINGSVYISDERFNSSIEWKAHLSDLYDSGTPLEVIRKLATPVTYPLTAPQVKTLLGLNNIWADTGDVELTFRKGAFATLEDVHDIIESSEDASIYHLGFCIKDGKLCQIYSKEEE